MAKTFSSKVMITIISWSSTMICLKRELPSMSSAVASAEVRVPAFSPNPSAPYILTFLSISNNWSLLTAISIAKTTSSSISSFHKSSNASRAAGSSRFPSSLTARSLTPLSLSDSIEINLST